MRGSSALLLAVALTACGNGGKASPNAEPATTTPAPATTTATPTPTATTAATDLEAVLRDAAIAMESYFSDNATYTKDVSKLLAEGMKPVAGVRVTVARANDTGYCIEASAAASVSHFDSNTGAVESGRCA